MMFSLRITGWPFGASPQRASGSFPVRPPHIPHIKRQRGHLDRCHRRASPGQRAGSPILPRDRSGGRFPIFFRSHISPEIRPPMLPVGGMTEPPSRWRSAKPSRSGAWSPTSRLAVFPAASPTRRGGARGQGAGRGSSRPRGCLHRVPMSTLSFCGILGVVAWIFSCKLDENL